jgi:predicted MPP superfamily phosphohydrolase
MSGRPRLFRGRRRRRWLLTAVTLFAVVIVFLAYGFGETYRLDVKEYTFSSPDLPAEFDGARIVLVTDIHRGPFFSQDRVRSLVERVNALEPDMIILGGDYVYLGTKYAASCFAELQNLRAPMGRFAVLRDQGVWVEKGGQRIRVGGIGDYAVDKPVLGPAIEGSGKRDFVLLISHNPDFAEKLPPDAVDLTLSGHTHGGQLTVFGLWAPFVPSENGGEYRTGMVTTDVTTVIISNGVGTSTIPPIRFFARPQIVVITLRAGDAPSADADPDSTADSGAFPNLGL